MKNAILFEFVVDKENHTIRVDRSFDAPLDLVWAAWTEADILDLWWAPKPWIARTKSMDFKEGGYWLYAMVGPEGEEHWCKAVYGKIVPHQSFSATDQFCDADGVPNPSLPSNRWDNTFFSNGETSQVTIQLSFDSLADLEKILEMGFREGFTMGLENLDQYIAAQFYLRKQKKTSTRARVSTYLNFPGTTEEAFLFYQSIFRTEFVGGIQRFEDIPPDPTQPPVSEAVRKMVLHVELPMIGGHILMGTDAPKEMGFTVTPGNNVHINLEPDSREETDRLFNALADGGQITMPLQEMFWGAYYGSVTDRYGVQWMVNYQLR